MAKKELPSGSGEAGFDESYDLSRRALLRLTLTTGAMLFGPVGFAAAQGAGGSPETPQTGGTLTIGADADPIGLDPTTVTAFSSFDFFSLIYSGLLRWTPDMKVEPDLATPLHRQLCDQLRELILGGSIPAESRLPSIRSFAGELAISRNTVITALDQLSAEGLLESRRGSGIHVARAAGVGRAGPNGARRSPSMPPLSARGE